jgi:peptidoglycan/xylan/chitin deacetylase (PgdA/CDA1 family)
MPSAAGPLMLRMDDVGAASKRHEVYGLTRLAVGRLRIPFPGNWLWLKYLPPIKRWGPYRELAAPDWYAILEALARAGARLTVGITAAWVEDDGTLTPFPRKFPDAAQAIRAGVDAGLLEVANHGLTHCLLADRAFRPRLFSGNRSFHREFYDFVPPEAQEANIRRAQAILADAFGVAIVTLVPPGNLLQPVTAELARRHGVRYLSYRAATTRDGILPVVGDDAGVVFHDRDLVLGGAPWLRARLEAVRGREIVFVRELGERLANGAL